jgi:hypothetical protein
LPSSGHSTVKPAHQSTARVRSRCCRGPRSR